MTLNGLSLCIQGTRLAISDHLAPVRFIPVYTGNTIDIMSEIAAATVYPCVYREHVLSGGANEDDCGLSLCIQGTPAGKSQAIS